MKFYRWKCITRIIRIVLLNIHLWSSTFMDHPFIKNHSISPVHAHVEHNLTQHVYWRTLWLIDMLRWLTYKYWFCRVLFVECCHMPSSGKSWYWRPAPDTGSTDMLTDPSAGRSLTCTKLHNMVIGVHFFSHIFIRIYCTCMWPGGVWVNYHRRQGQSFLCINMGGICQCYSYTRNVCQEISHAYEHGLH